MSASYNLQCSWLSEGWFWRLDCDSRGKVTLSISYSFNVFFSDSGKRTEERFCPIPSRSARSKCDSVRTEMIRWRCKWQNVDDKPSTLIDSLIHAKVVSKHSRSFESSLNRASNFCNRRGILQCHKTNQNLASINNNWRQAQWFFDDAMMPGIGIWFLYDKKRKQNKPKKNNKNLKIGYDLITLFFKYNYNTMAKVFYGHAR